MVWPGGRKGTQQLPNIVGAYTFAYDPNGNLTQSVDPRGASGTVYAGYDGLNRQLWRNTTNSSNGAYAAYTYDGTANGNKGVGRLTGETFNTGANLGAGSYAYTYDARGQRTGQTIQLNATSYTFAFSYNDAGQPTSLTYSDGAVLSFGYSALDWMTSASATPSGGAQVNLFTNIGYAGVGGASKHPTSASAANGTYTVAAGFDNALRLTSSSLTNVGSGATVYGSQRSFDAAGNVTGVGTTLAAGTDTQAFCYDEQNRLTWASAAGGTIPCGGTNSAGSLTAAGYTQSFAYDALDRLTSSPLGGYAYNDPSHLHAATGAGTSYTAAYDAAGDMACRAPTNAAACTATNSGGAKLTYDAERRLVGWQDKPTNPTSSASFAYDGDGQRVAQAASGGATTYYLGGLEEVAAAGGGATTLTKYYNASGLPAVAVDVGGTLSYLASDALGSNSEALDGAGNVTAQQLYAPYGGARYGSGAMPTTKGFTGQRADAASGLDYYNARYYDPVLGQFASADTVDDGANRFGYVGGNPETRTDPSGHCFLVCAVVSAVAHTVSQVAHAVAPAVSAAVSVAATVADAATGFSSMVADVHTLFDGNKSFLDKALAVGDLALNVAMDASMVVGVGEGVKALYMGGKALLKVGAKVAEHEAAKVAEREAEEAVAKTAEHAVCPLSFAPDTAVATPDRGAVPIAALKAGDRVVAYDPTTGKAGVQVVEATSITHDTDLLDVTLRVATEGAKAAPSAVAKGAANGSRAASGGSAPAANQTAVAQTAAREEVVHTTARHPWLTVDVGWVPAGYLKVGEPVRLLDGRTATVAATRVVPGAAAMWDLTVSNVHTFAVGDGRFVVHNCGNGVQDTWQKTKVLSNGQTKAEYVSGATECEFCGLPFKSGERKIIEHAYARKTALEAADSQEVFDTFVKDTDGFSVVCASCNGVKGTKTPGNFRVYKGGVAGYEERLMNKYNLIAERYGFPT